MCILLHCSTISDIYIYILIDISIYIYIYISIYLSIYIYIYVHRNPQIDVLTVHCAPGLQGSAAKFWRFHRRT